MDVIEQLPAPDTIREGIDRLRREARVLRQVLTLSLLAKEIRDERRGEPRKPEAHADAN